jgi:hypothetical protein
MYKRCCGYKISVADPDPFDIDPALHFDTDLDPDFKFDMDSDLGPYRFRRVM